MHIERVRKISRSRLGVIEDLSFEKQKAETVQRRQAQLNIPAAPLQVDRTQHISWIIHFVNGSAHNVGCFSYHSYLKAQYQGAVLAFLDENFRPTWVGRRRNHLLL